MGENSKISWTHHTFNPVRGCRYAELPDGSPSPACEQGPGCYAESMSKRNPATLGEWGPSGARVFASESYWRQPVKWGADAEAAGERRRVFCASLADIFEGAAGPHKEARDCTRPDYLSMLARLFDLIRATPWLDWLLLTKRPWNAARWPAYEGKAWPDNAWIGATVENRAAALDRGAWLCRVPARVRFVSMEPLFEDVDGRGTFRPDKVNWCIVGGQSGPGAAPFDMDVARSIVAQCKAGGIPVFVKQLGSAWAKANGSTTRAGTDPNEWPVDLRVQEFPHV